MRFCPECGGLVHVYYAFRAAQCQHCGREWPLDRYALAIEACQTMEDYCAAQASAMKAVGAHA